MRNIIENRILERNFVLMGIDNLLQLTVNVLAGSVWTILGKGSFWEVGGGGTTILIIALENEGN